MVKNEKEWQEVRLGDICIINYGKGLIKSKVIKGHIPVYSSSGITNYHNNSLVNSKGIIIGRKGNAGSVFYSKVPFFCIDTTFYITENKNYDLNFLYYNLISLNLTNYITGTAVPGITRRDLYSINTKLPPLEEQKKIASILSSLDDKIELNNRMNKILEEMAQTIFKEWFVNFNFPNEEGKPYKDSGGKMIESELGAIPDGWKVGIIKDISKEVICGKTPPTKDEKNYGDYMPFITIPDMHNNTFIIKSERYLSNKGVNTQINKTVPENSICVSCIATVGLVSLTSENSQTNQQINTIIPKKNISSYWVYFYMKNISNIIINYAFGGTTTLNLNKSLFEKINIIIPEISILDTFNNNIKSIFDMIKSNQIENQKLDSIRDTLLPKLMSGEIRVK